MPSIFIAVQGWGVHRVTCHIRLRGLNLATRDVGPTFVVSRPVPQPGVRESVMRASRRNAPSLASHLTFGDGFGTRAFSAELPGLLERPERAFTTSTTAPADGDPIFDDLQSTPGGLDVPGNFYDRDGDAQRSAARSAGSPFSPRCRSHPKPRPSPHTTSCKPPSLVATRGLNAFMPH